MADKNMQSVGEFVKIMNNVAAVLQKLVVAVFKFIPKLIKKILETK